MSTGAIPKSEFAERRARFLQALGADGVAVIPAAPERTRNRDVLHPYRQDSDFRYLTGFDEPQAVAVFAPGRTDGEFVLFCRERDPAREIWDGFRAGPEGARADYDANQALPIDALDAQLPALLANRASLHYALGADAGLDQRILAARERVASQGGRGAKAPPAIVAPAEILHEMRLFKSDAERAAMRTAGVTSARAHCRAMQAATPGLREYQLAALLHYEFAHDGMEPAYPSIVGGGANACVLHYIDNRDSLADGDLVLIDAGAEHAGYAADITRTFPVNGRFSGPQRALYDVVLAAQHAAIDAVRAGSDYDAPNRAAVRVLSQGLLDLGLLAGTLEAVIEQGDYRRFYMHGTGHWLGMDVHDVGDYKRDGAWRALAPGMTLTIEPGLYIPPDATDVDPRFAGLGIRIEDDLYVTDGAPQILSEGVPTDPDAIEALMAG